jgi:hypothetical protein
VSPQRIQRKRAKGWRLPPGAVSVSRPRKDNPGPWGNPFTIEQYGRAQAVALHRAWLLAQPELVAKVKTELRGRDLVCWCKPGEPCHADTLLDVANGGPR